MKGWKTLVFNAAVAAAGGLVPFLASVDWTQYVSPNVAILIVAGINIALRFVTTTAVGSAK